MYFYEMMEKQAGFAGAMGSMKRFLPSKGFARALGFTGLGAAGTAGLVGSQIPEFEKRTKQEAVQEVAPRFMQAAVTAHKMGLQKGLRYGYLAGLNASKGEKRG